MKRKILTNACSAVLMGVLSPYTTSLPLMLEGNIIKYFDTNLININLFHSYMCTADNGVGNPVSEEVLLTVLCKYFAIIKFVKN